MHNEKYTVAPWEVDTVYLDTETTGLYATDRLVEIAILDDNGNALVNTLINPETTIPDEVIRIHGITNKMVADAPIFSDLEDQIIEAVSGKRVVIYNSAFDMKFFPASVKGTMDSVECCMLRFAAYYGEWNEYYDNYRWQKLAFAAECIGYQWDVNDAHRALADTKACRAVWKYLNENEKEKLL